MSLLKPLFSFENRMQAMFMQVDAEARAVAKVSIEASVAENHVLIYTYPLSPFSQEALAILKVLCDL